MKKSFLTIWITLILCVTASAQYQPRPLTIGTGSGQAMGSVAGTGTGTTINSGTFAGSNTVTGSLQSSGTGKITADALPNVVIASKAGAHLDTDLQTGGGTDDTAALQAVLNTASSSNPLTFIINGPARCSGLALKGHTHLIFPAKNCGLFITGSCKNPALRNYNRTRGDDVTDEDITVEGGYINANGANQGPTRQEVETADSHTVLCGISFHGCHFLTFRNVDLVNPNVFGFWFSNVSDVRVEHCSSAAGSDGLHFDGKSHRAYAYDFHSNGTDDAFALNADDGIITRSSAFVACPGPISEIVADGFYVDNQQQAFRLLSGDGGYIDNVVIRNMYGKTYDHLSKISDFNSTGDNHIGNVLLDNISVEFNGSDYPFPIGINNGGGGEDGPVTIDSLSITNFVRKGTNTQPIVYLGTGSTIGNLRIDGLIDMVGGASIAGSGTATKKSGDFFSLTPSSITITTDGNTVVLTAGTNGLLANGLPVLTGTASIPGTMRDGLVDEYLFASGNELVDTGSNGINLTNTGTVTFSGSSAVFSGTNHLQMSGTVNCEDAPVTVACVVSGITNTSSIGGDRQMIVGKTDYVTATTFMLAVDAYSPPGAAWAYQGAAAVGADISDGATHVIVAEYSLGNYSKITVDGNSQVVASGSGSTGIPAGFITIGSEQGGTVTGLRGEVSKVRIWNRSLTTEETTALVNGY